MTDDKETKIDFSAMPTGLVSRMYEVFKTLVEQSYMIELLDSIYIKSLVNGYAIYLEDFDQKIYEVLTAVEKGGQPEEQTDFPKLPEDLVERMYSFLKTVFDEMFFIEDGTWAYVNTGYIMYIQELEESPYDYDGYESCGHGWYQQDADKEDMEKLLDEINQILEK